nr:hypothetical conserved protein [uncultured Gammaproteobacteria bacterium]
MGCLWILAATAWGHGPTPQKSDSEITIQAPLAQVWEKLKSPSELCAWHPLVKRCELSGSVRTLELASGERFSEEVLEVDEQNHIVYVRQGQPNVLALPISSYSYRLEAQDNGDGSVTVRWKARYYRGDTGNFPPPGLSDEAAVQAMDNWIKTGLKELKAACEKTGS